MGEWQAFYEIDPWGEQRADLRIAQLCSIFYNANRKKGAPALKPKDFLLCPDEGQKQKKTTAQMFEIMKSLAAVTSKNRK